ncbi:MAG: LON peptidase substrate-binding domain-containing protein [Chloroflexota bacterium]|nr:LON peptidase substrate-binding domain-containing protein [Chloroflexota bacterium]
MQGLPTIFNVPLFPLSTALFPRMPLPLHIFEERYKEMIRDLRLWGNRFCVALIREGTEVGDHADPYMVGCLAELVNLRPLADEKYNLVAMGVERVRILSIDSVSKSYLIGEVELWPDEGSQADAPLVARASRLFMEYAGYLMDLSGDRLGEFTLPAEPDTLSYVLATALQIASPERQRLLEMPGCAQRLKAEVRIMQAEMPVLHALVKSPRPPAIGDGKFSAN